MTKEQEQLTIEAVLTGDNAAFAMLVNTYKDRAVNLAYNILLNTEDAEEVAQDAFVRVYRSLGDFRGAARFSTWLYRVVVNTALNKKKLKKPHSVEITGSLHETLSSAPDSISLYQLRAEHKKHINIALQVLTVNERLCITLYYLEELTVEEIKAITGISASNVKVLLFRGRKNLYTALQKYLKTELTHLI
ncbi:MAG: sigma-70 family RNA polymerase sigma factor [Ferruginibacter sp.]